MLTQNEINSLSLSPTKKDFVQIWNELLEVAGKLSERWDPTSTNESDPGIVILKALAGIADKLNYNIDKNTLEAFMPTAAQEDSMRKLCDMLGYNIKYYQSAMTEVTVKYYNSDPSDEEKQALAGGLLLPKFTVITNSDQDINYFTLNKNPIYISAEDPSKTVSCMEGQIVKCESINDNNVITANQISENNRFYLPETQIAENGIFIYNVSNNTAFGGSGLDDGTEWEKVDNLNVQVRGSRVYKFGFDSYESRPYIEFPEDFSELFNDGIFIYYARTSGASGNVSARTLTKLELPTGDKWSQVSAESFSVENAFSATTGTNIETIKQAYNNFKKTIGTFETLVTCRDYMNKIYTMVNSVGKPYVSNILVTDIRNDINRAITICSCDDAGIFYKETPILVTTRKIEETKEELTSTATPYTLVGNEEDYKYELVGKEEDYEYELVGKEEDYEYETVDEGEYKLVGNEEDYLYEEVDRDTGPVKEISNVITDPKTVSNETTTKYIISEANKPIFGEPVVIQFGSLGSGGAFRGTNWRLGTTTGLPLFADEYYDSFIKDNYTNFSSNSTGEVVTVDSAGKESTVWYIKQGNTFFKTTLPITKVASTETTIVNEQTKTITNQVTETIKEQRTLKEQKIVKEQRTLQEQRTLREQRTLKEQSIKTDTYTNTNIVANEYAIDHFDLVLYPFKSYNQIKNNVKDVRKVYDASFSYSPSTFNSLKGELDNSPIKTIAHTLISPRPADEDGVGGDIVSINNYLRLNATIATNSKITVEEGAIIIDKIKIALANAFNMRELDFGEEIPFDNIVEVIENADSRIRIASLNEPALYTTFSVYKGLDRDGLPIIKEFAVASDWLSLEEAKTVSQLDTTSVDKNGNFVGTFNTEEARKIYNKLAVRNVLAGRVPLFNYNNTFKTSFSEGAYQVTVEAKDIPTELPKPDSDNPFTIYSKDGVVYTGQFIDENTINYTETFTPETYANNVITSVDGNAITDIVTSCRILSDKDANGDNKGTITDVTLEAGEFVQFRAPNFTTIKTYPAYVNYHLALNKELLFEAANAKATTLFDLLEADRDTWSLENTDIKWQKVLDYFTAIDTNTSRPEELRYKKTGVRTQKISKYTPPALTETDACPNNTSGHDIDESTGKCRYCGNQILNKVQKGPIVIDINDDVAKEEKDLGKLLNKSGCIRLSNNHEIVFNTETGLYEVKAILRWDTSDGDPLPNSTGPDLDIRVSLSNIFISDATILSRIDEAVLARLEVLKSQVQADGSTPVLPTDCAWSISFEYEGVPFEPSSLVEWENLVKSNTDLFDFAPIADNGTIFWRVYGEGYSTGKYILQSTEKLLKFDSTYFGLLPATPLRGIYLIEDPGKDSQPAVIKNNEEYKLRANEYLYIEYTPSAITEDGTTQDLEAITEILGPGTIIRPSGFEAGLMDSTVYTTLGNSPHKTVTFETENNASLQIAMQRFGANEQVEIRDFAKVELTKNSFSASSAIWYYKNFNGCDELENISNPNRTYTLKDGEYIFYTDQNKAELAYFTTGTQVTLEGNLVLDQFDIIDLSTIFDSGLSEIPWKYKSFSGTDKITFQEYQYITLGPDDTLKNITLMHDKTGLSGEWQYCNDVEYSLAGSEETIKLSAVNTYTDRIESSKGNGWEARSTLELDVAHNNAQTLRNTDQVQTSIELISTSPSGGGKSEPILIKPEDGAHPLSFKTNLSCQTGSSQINIEDIYSNPNKLKGFEFKIFATDAPAVVETESGKVVPYRKNNITDITAWSGEPLAVKDSSELWSSVSLDKIKATTTNDCALRLPISVLPNTYGVFCIYLSYTSDEALSNAKIWIEVLPGTSHKDITLLNIPKEDLVWETAADGTNNADKLFLRPGINCIRVNKTSRIFIKASDTAQGTLFFDELKLVNCQPIEYRESTGESVRVIPLTTQGLNLAQLGYLNPADSTALDEAMREKLKASYIDSAYADVDVLNKETEKDFSSRYHEVSECKPKLQKLVSFIEKATKEIEALLNLYSDANAQIDESLLELLQKYSQLYNELLNEKALLEALDDNKNIDNLEQQLVTVLESFSIIETTQQQLLTDLELLKTKAIANAEHFSKQAILNDFESVANPLIDSQLVDEIKAASVDKVNTQYNEQLSLITNGLEKVTNFDERVRLLTILENLQSAKLTDQQAELLINIRQLIEKVDQTQINGYLDSAYDCALKASYAELASELTQLREQLSTNDFKVLVTSIELAANEESYSRLTGLVDDLKKLISAADTQLVKDIDNLIKTVQTKVTSASTTVDNSILDTITEIRTSISTDYEAQLTAILTTVSDILNNSDTPYAETLKSLQDTEDSQVLEILDKIDTITDIRDTTLVTISLFGTAPDFSLKDDYRALPFGEEATVVVWSNYMKTALITGVERLYTDIYTAISNLSIVDNNSVLELWDGFYIDDTKSSLRDALSTAANIIAFQNIFGQVKNLSQKRNQNSARRLLVDELSKLIPVTSELSTAMSTLEAIGSDRNAIMCGIIDKLKQETTVVERQQLLRELRSELDNAIQVDSSLVNISANLLCPSLLLFENFMPEAGGETPDVFYEKLADKVGTYRADLLNSANKLSDVTDLLEVVKSTFTTYTTSDRKLLEVLNSESRETFKDWLMAVTDPTFVNNSLLPNNYQSTLAELRELVSVQTEIKKVKETDFIGLSSTELSIWLESEVTDEPLKAILSVLIDDIIQLEQTITVNDEFKDAYNTLLIEELLLADIRALDTNCDFYYTAPVDSSLAIEFNESNTAINTLMNPATNYDINNINNNFVISKLDIDYLDKGIQIARSSRLN